MSQEAEALVKERKCIKHLLDMDGVKLKCICWPKLRFLGYYPKKQKRKRVKLLHSFLKESLLEHYLTRREVLCNNVGSKGNLLIIGDKIAIVAEPEAIEFTHTSVSDDPQIVKALIREYDILFERILQARKFDQIESKLERHRALINDTITMLSQEVKQWREREKASKGSL